jgi:L-threonylcarbamoyladenylate synthase
MKSAAVEALLRGEVIAVPTEAVYGLSVDPRNLQAVQRLIDLKQRNPAKGLILVASDFSQLEAYLEPLPPAIQDQLFATWPGPFTWVVPAKPSVSPLLRGQFSSIAVRVTAHPVLASLCKAVQGPLVSSSANPEGLPPATTEKDLRAYFGDDLLLVPGALGGLAKPTEIRDAMTGSLIRGQ